VLSCDISNDLSEIIEDSFSGCRSDVGGHFEWNWKTNWSRNSNSLTQGCEASGSSYNVYTFARWACNRSSSVDGAKFRKLIIHCILYYTYWLAFRRASNLPVGVVIPPIAVNIDNPSLAPL